MVSDQRVKIALDSAEELLRCSEEIHLGQSYYKHVARMFLYAAVDDFKAILLLLSNKLVTQAVAVVRHLFELVVDLKYIHQEPENRAKLYADYDVVRRYKLVRIWDKCGGDEHLSKEDRKIIEEEYRKVKSYWGYDKPPRDWSSWSGCSSIQCRAQRLGVKWSNLYDYVYRTCSMYSHPDPTGMANLRSFGDSGGYEYRQPENLERLVDRFSVKFFLDIIRETNLALEGSMEEKNEKLKESDPED